MKTKELNTYKVTSVHDVYVVSHENGEENHVNSYTLSYEIEAANWQDAIKKYFSDYLYFKVNFAYAYIDDNSNTFSYSNLVDEYNIEASDIEIELWKENNLTLYSNLSEISVHQLVEINLK